ncbi:IPT/TIG domain-containing protein [Reichenbachiella ulvae]|uniref:IPT/TIG domain-containing protein n=1 Tax=Reichenbachiella ulvae TaxID=2980104 RepID=A0ABT3CUD7_9BACT|nr:IPT/TIG domain-containing protein [Reichenbachiella ulvae]MCV9387310.1 IPT/TIG domain-containing protein [Reichenbachiella ulvae]
MYKNLSNKIKKSSLWLLASMIMVSAISSCSDDESNEPRIPTITSLSATSGEPGEDVTITGTDLGEALSVTFGAGTATVVSNTETEIVATIPEDGTTGKVTVRTEGGVAESAQEFTVIIVGAVIVEGISPMSAQVGEEVTITGVDFATVSSVHIGDVAASIVSNDETSAVITVPEGAALGLSSLTIVNDGGSTTTSSETNAFYVIKMLAPEYRMTFDNDDVELSYSGSPDTEESTVYGRSDDVSNVADVATALPAAIDGTFFHMEGYSSTDFSGSYVCYVGTPTQEVGTYADFFGDALAQDIYFNIQLHVGDLPEGYTGAEDDGQMVAGLRFRFADDYYEYNPTLQDLSDMGFEANEDGWISISVPATLFEDRAALGEFSFADMNRIGVSVRRAYGGGTTLPLSDDPDAIFYSMSFDNVSVSIGGPVSF